MPGAGGTPDSAQERKGRAGTREVRAPDSRPHSALPVGRMREDCELRSLGTSFSAAPPSGSASPDCQGADCP